MRELGEPLPELGATFAQRTQRRERVRRHRPDRRRELPRAEPLDRTRAALPLLEARNVVRFVQQRRVDVIVVRGVDREPEVLALAVLRAVDDVAELDERREAEPRKLVDRAAGTRSTFRVRAPP